MTWSRFDDVHATGAIAPQQAADLTSAGLWTSTYTGKRVQLLKPRLEDIDIEDIAHHLAHLNRWVGSTRVPYSVAQHSVLVATLCPPDAQLWALLHDASEAYLGDVNARLKAWQGMSRYLLLEDVHQRMIYQRFGLSGDVPPIVREADLMVRAAEALDLRLHPIEEYRGVQRAAMTITPEPPARAKGIFLKSFERLMARQRVASEASAVADAKDPRR